MGQFVDGLKFAGGTCTLMQKTFIKEITEMAHRHNVNVGTGDWAELLLQKGPSAFKQYVQVGYCSSPPFYSICSLAAMSFCIITAVIIWFSLNCVGFMFSAH